MGVPDLSKHRVAAADPRDVVVGSVHFAPAKALWFGSMAIAAIVGTAWTASVAAFVLFLAATGTVLLLGHSLGSHRKLIHDSFQCPKPLEYVLVYLGVQVGLAGPLGLMRQHELRDYAQRLPDCHPYLRHGSGAWKDAWWQLFCELRLVRAPEIRIEERIERDPFYRFLERTWMWQQLPIALAFFAWGGWAFVFWGTCARVTAGIFGHWLIGYFAHNQGGMHHEVRGAAVQGRNIPFTSFLTMGESWHNNHHAFPGSARLGLYAGEWDPGWWVLMLLRRAGWAWGIRTPRNLPYRKELRALGLRRPVPRERRNEVLLVVPAAPLNARQLRWFVGSRLEIRTDGYATRLELWNRGRRVRGLPALLEAIALRSRRWATAASVVMPAARCFEEMRMRWDLA